MSHDPKEEEAKLQMELDIRRFKLKKLIKQLESARGNGTSMITLLIPPKDQISRVNKMLGEEQGTAQHIKSHVNKLSVLEAIAATMQRLKLYSRVPDNGLAIFCGNVMLGGDKDKKVTIDVVPFKPLPRSMYMCDSRFHTETLKDMLESDEKYGFVIMDGNGSLFATIQGSVRDVLYRYSVELPKKHAKGGQSSMRFARIRLEKRAAYVKKVAELTTQMFVPNDRPNISGLILAGSAEFKNFLAKKENLDERLRPLLMKVVDVSYGSDSGLNQAIELSADVLGNVKFVQEKKVITKFLDELRDNTSRYSAGIDETMQALDMGAIQTLIVWEDLPHVRVTVHHPDGPKIYVCLPDEISEKVPSADENGNKLDTTIESVTDYVAESYSQLGYALEFVSNKSPEGIQFCRGFGGMGALLRYAVDFRLMNEHATAGPGAAGPAGGETAESEDDAADDPLARFCDDDFM